MKTYQIRREKTTICLFLPAADLFDSLPFFRYVMATRTTAAEGDSSMTMSFLSERRREHAIAEALMRRAGSPTLCLHEN